VNLADNREHASSRASVSTDMIRRRVGHCGIVSGILTSCPSRRRRALRRFSIAGTVEQTWVQKEISADKQVWLRDCIYKRLVKKGRKPGTMESMATFLTSAVWVSVLPQFRDMVDIDEHGFDAGYYSRSSHVMALTSVAFIMAGVLTSLGRQMRHSVRPYFLPPSTSPPSAPNSLPKWPYPNTAKRAYDVAGWIMVQTNLNYIASAFVLLSLKDCVRAWHRMGWYTPVLVTIAMVFFQSGGRRALRKGLEGKKKDETPGKVPSLQVSPPSPHDERDPKDLRWVKHALDTPTYQDGGAGVDPDGGLVDGIMRGAETPLSETPRSGTPKLKEQLTGSFTTCVHEKG